MNAVDDAPREAAQEPFAVAFKPPHGNRWGFSNVDPKAEHDSAKRDGWDVELLYTHPAPLRPVTDEIDIEYPPLPRCWSGSPVTVTWLEDGEQTTREVYSSDQMHEYALKAVESFRSRLAGESTT